MLLPEADGKATDVLPALVLKPWKKLAKSVKELDDPPPDEQLHAVRIRAKRVRYAVEAVAPVVGKQAKALASAVAGLQAVLGDHQDATVAEAWLREAADDDGVSALVAGELIALERVGSRGLPSGVVGGVARGEGPEAAQVAPLSLGRLGLGRSPGPVRAGGGVVWRRGDDGQPVVILVHRPKYDDWSLPKGKLQPGEDEADAAVREVEEETGLRLPARPRAAQQLATRTASAGTRPSATGP